MNLHFVTSVSKDYWYATGQYCIKTWNLPGKVTVFVEQLEGDIKWVSEIPFNVELLRVPPLKIDDEFIDRKKVLKFWGKSCAQILAVRNREIDERVVWIDADVEQLLPVDSSLFEIKFDEPFGIMNSYDNEDCWETGMVIFNQTNEKLGIAMKKYDRTWKDDEVLSSLWRPYDAQVLGHVGLDRGFFNLCKTPCKNVSALKNSIFGNHFKHHINKENKALLQLSNVPKDSSNIS